MVPHLHAWKVAFVSSPDSGDPPLGNRMFNCQRCWDLGRTLFVSVLGDGELDGTGMHVGSKHSPSTFKARTRSVHVPFSTAFCVVGTRSDVRLPRILYLCFSFFLGLETPSSSTSNVATLLSSPPVPFEYSRHRYRSVSFPPTEYSQVEQPRRPPAIDVSVSSDGTRDVFAPLNRTWMRLASQKDGEEGEGSVERRTCEFQRASRRARRRKRGR